MFKCFNEPKLKQGECKNCYVLLDWGTKEDKE